MHYRNAKEIWIQNKSLHLKSTHGVHCQGLEFKIPLWMQSKEC